MIKEVKILSPEELFENNQGLVLLEVNRALPRLRAGRDSHGFIEEDLKQLGAIGLWKACLTFKHELGFKFSTHAIPKIHGEIMNGFRNSELINISRTVKSISSKIIKEGLELTLEEIMEKYDCSKKDAECVVDYITAFKYISIHHPINDGEDASTLEDVIEDINSSFEDEIITKIELEKRLSIIDEDSRKAILLALQGKTQREIGNIMGINQVRVSRITIKALDKINKEYNTLAII